MTPTLPQLLRELQSARKSGLFEALRLGASTHRLALSFVLAIASRETGIRNIEGDGGHGRGVLQIDDRSHEIARTTDFANAPEVLVLYGCEMLASNIEWAKRLRPGYSPDQYLKMASSAYNCGRGGVLKALASGDCDARTTGHDYGADVLKRMDGFAQLLSR